MKLLSISQLVIFILIFSVGITVCDAQASGNRAPKPEKKGLFGLFSGKKSNGKVAPKSPAEIKKEQAKKKKKEDEDYAKAVKESQKKASDIQTPAVKKRMKQNQKDIKAREKAKKKKDSSSSKKAAQKYK